VNYKEIVQLFRRLLPGGAAETLISGMTGITVIPEIVCEK